MKPKTLVVSVPRLEPHRPPISTAIISNCISSAGFPVDSIDLNIKFYNYLNNPSAYYNYDEVFDEKRDITLTEYKTIVSFLNKCYKPTLNAFNILAISVFGSSSRLFAQIISKYTRKHARLTSIVIGGAGVLSNNLHETEYFGQTMLKNGLCDYYISGDGERSIVELLKGNTTYPGINSDDHLQLEDLDHLPIPDYSYYDLNDYDYLQADREVSIVASRGCVRACTYCDVGRYWPKFKFRSGQNIADELIHHYEEHSITRFYFTDSLVNGSQKAFLDMCRTLAQYNKENDAGFKWSGQFIFKREHQLNDDYFKVMAESGADQVYVGVETGSDRVRFDMDKKFTNDDIDYHLTQFKKYGIRVFFLMFTGYVTEKMQDHNETLNLFKRWQYYVATGTISGIDLGTMLDILPETPIAEMIDQYEIEFLPSIVDHLSLKNVLWTANTNSELTVRERIRRYTEVHKTAIDYNWPVWRGDNRLEYLKMVTELYIKYTSNPAKDK